MFVNNIEKQPHIAGLKVSATPRVLADIHEDWCNAAVWDRRPLATFQSWIDALTFEQLPTARLILRPSFAKDAIISVCRLTKISDEPNARVFADDVAALTHLFASVMNTEFVRLRLQTSNDHCQRELDAKNEKVRLNCVYRGMGLLCEAASGHDGRVQTYTVPNGSAVITRGQLWQSDTFVASVCPIPIDEHPNEVSLVLTLEAVSDGGPIPSIYH